MVATSLSITFLYPNRSKPSPKGFLFSAFWIYTKLTVRRAKFACLYRTPNLPVQSTGQANYPITGSGVMCYFELITYRCQHQIHRRCSYCHFARNDPAHACFGVRMLKRAWREEQEDCEECVRRRQTYQEQQGQQQHLAIYRTR